MRSIRQHSASVTDTTTWVFDALGQLVQEASPDGGMIRYLYDLDGSPQTILHELGRIQSTNLVLSLADHPGRELRSDAWSDPITPKPLSSNDSASPKVSESPPE